MVSPAAISIPEVGSSNSKMSGFPTNAHAIKTLCCCPLDNTPICWLRISFPNPTEEISVSISLGLPPFSLRNYATVKGKSGSIENLCGTYPIFTPGIHSIFPL